MNIEEDGKTYIKIKDRQEKSIIEKNKVLENLSKLEPLENEEYSIEEELEEVMKENKQLKERFERLVQEHIDTINRNEEKQQRIDKANELLSKIVVREREDGNWGAVKNTREQDVYKTIWKLYEILDTSSYRRNEMLKIFGDKE